MSFISYSQNYEDVMLWRALKHVENGFYIDIGANDPVEHSVTKSMYDLGWSGINCEPVQHWFSKLEENRINDLNLQVAIGATNEELEFFEVVNTGLSTLDKSIAEQHAIKYGFELISYTVPVECLTSVCNRTNIDEVHFLKIDVEGAEKSVLQGIDFKQIRPWIVVVEATKPMSQDVDYEQWEYLITSEKYHFVYFDGLNRFYIADEHSELDYHFDRPPNVFDGFVLSSQITLEAKTHEFWSRVSEAEVKVSEAEAKVSEAEAKVSEAEAKAHEWWLKATEAEELNHAILSSNSWRIMKPFRFFSYSLNTVKLGCKAWLKFAPGSRPRRLLKKSLLAIKYYVISKPYLLKVSLNILSYFPRFKSSLKSIVIPDLITNQVTITELSSRGNEVYEYIKLKRLKK